MDQPRIKLLEDLKYRAIIVYTRAKTEDIRDLADIIDDLLDALLHQKI